MKDELEEYLKTLLEDEKKNFSNLNHIRFTAMHEIKAICLKNLCCFGSCMKRMKDNSKLLRAFDRGEEILGREMDVLYLIESIRMLKSQVNLLSKNVTISKA